MMPKKITCLSTLLLLMILTTLSSCREDRVEELQKEVLFELGFGKMEDQINFFIESDQDRLKKNRIVMKDGFFYISNALSGKVMEFNSYGDIINLFYNTDRNPDPVLLAPRASTGEAATRNLYPYPFQDVGEIALGRNKTLFVDDRISVNRRERDEDMGVTLERIILQFDRDGRFIDYLGQEGNGGTPFPYIDKIRVTERDELVVFTRNTRGWRVFWFSAEKKPLYVVDILNDQLPVPESLGAPDLLAILENLECDLMERRLYLKIDYYAESIARESQTGSGFGGSFIWWLNMTDETYSGRVRIPAHTKDSGKPQMFEEDTTELIYEFIGLARGEHLFLASLEGRNSYQLLILRPDGLVVKSGHINLGEERLESRQFFVTPQGILTGFLGWTDRVEIAWWRTDRFIQGEEP